MLLYIFCSVLQGEVLFHLASSGRTVKEEWRDGRRVSTEEEEEEEELSSGSGLVLVCFWL